MGCGGSDDPPDLEATAPVTTREAPAIESAETAPATGPAAPVPARQRGEIRALAAATADAVVRWDDALAACIGPSGHDDEPAATCTSSAWEQLFDRMYAAHAQLLDLIDRVRAGPCHEALGSELDAVHGFVSGATPTNVVWLDEHQQPPSRFDLETIVDLVRPVPGRLRAAAATTCAP